jgi:menaquinone-9 beta-reductase
MPSHFLASKQKEIRMDHSLTNIGQEYTRQWMAHCAPRIRAANLFTQIAIRPKAVALFLPLFKRFPRFISYGAELSGKVRLLAVS